MWKNIRGNWLFRSRRSNLTKRYPQLNTSLRSGKSIIVYDTSRFSSYFPFLCSILFFSLFLPASFYRYCMQWNYRVEERRRERKKKERYVCFIFIVHPTNSKNAIHLYTVSVYRIVRHFVAKTIITNVNKKIL